MKLVERLLEWTRARVAFEPSPEGKLAWITYPDEGFSDGTTMCDATLPNGNFVVVQKDTIGEWSWTLATPEAALEMRVGFKSALDARRHFENLLFQREGAG